MIFNTTFIYFNNHIFRLPLIEDWLNMRYVNPRYTFTYTTVLVGHVDLYRIPTTIGICSTRT